MKKILFLPLLQMQSGHHHAADAIIDILQKQDQVLIKKIDILSYTSAKLEKIVAGGYLKWIRYAPQTYNFTYKTFFCRQPGKEQGVKWYQHLFLKSMMQLLDEEKPDAIVCTHGFPSFLLSQLKIKGKCQIPVINVYTDFFINKFWGMEGIDLHFLPTQEEKQKLANCKIPQKKMIVTGIPVHGDIKGSKRRKRTVKPKILVAGGSSGLGGILALSDELKKSRDTIYYVLCGKNRKLYNKILSWKLDHIKPLSYISDKQEMDKLYNEVDAIITKPGGVTVSEALHKKLPIFVHAALPGQEEINLTYLHKKGLVFPIDAGTSLELQVLGRLKDADAMDQWQQALNTYHNGMEIDQRKLAKLISQTIMETPLSISSLQAVKPKVLDVARA
ncbi:MGDG synthase family glycosyltransferase [Peribacillus kribbensis]|uniref:MGDG synthase family glycosyltransferase n=1 Tax=Peribacillus kribbensis TaxID=356658 RepID=UPI00047A97BB|nr:galactosyldiacylglycerol synthase [Peribacillus kribbensis]